MILIITKCISNEKQLTNCNQMIEDNLKKTGNTQIRDLVSY